jgi:hypothetical protein
MPSVGCYSRGGHEVIPVFTAHLAQVYGQTLSTRHINDRPKLAGPRGQRRSAGI